jgi:hypothetical protein
MKTIKVITEFGIMEAKLRKVFEFEGYKFAVVDFPYKYMNSTDFSYIIRTVHYESGGNIPVYSKHKQTLKSFVEVSIETLELIYKREGAEKFKEVIETYETINPV